jgi:predicted MFS family arabinose efflux permease
MGLYVGSQYFGLTVGTILGAIIASINGLVSPNFLVGSLIGFFAIIICFFYFKETSEQTTFD